MTVIPEWQIDSRVVITPEQCAIDNAHFYLRGRIVVPIRGCDQSFVWGVWAQVSAADFYRSYKGWSTVGRENEPAFMGRLANDLLRFGAPAGIELEIQTQVVGRRPHFFVRSGRHLLGREQRDGITLARAEEVAALLLHPEAETFVPAIFAT